MRVNGVEAVPINWTERIFIILIRQRFFGANKWGGGGGRSNGQKGFSSSLDVRVLARVNGVEEGVGQMDRKDFHHL